MEALCLTGLLAASVRARRTLKVVALGCVAPALAVLAAGLDSWPRLVSRGLRFS